MSALKYWIPLIAILGIAAVFAVRSVRHPAARDLEEEAVEEDVIVVEKQSVPTVVLEAEDADEVEPPVSIVEVSSGASKGKCCYIGPEKVNEKPETSKYTKGNPNAAYPGFARMRFKVPESANYEIWVRVRWTDNCGDSLDVAVDGEMLGTLQGNADKYDPKWIWLPVGGRRLKVSRHLEAGREHTLTVCNREDDLYFDQILLQADGGAEPFGILTTE